MFSQMKTATKILLGFAFCILVSLVMGIAGYSGISDAENAMSTVGKTSLPSVKAVDQMLLAQQRVAYFNLMLNNRRVTDLTERARLQESVTENVKAFGQARSDYEPQPRTPDEDRLWRDVGPSIAEWLRTAEATATAAKAKDQLLTLGVALDDAKMKEVDDRMQQSILAQRSARHAVEKVLEQIQDINVELAHTSVAAAEKESAQDRAMMTGVFAVGALVAILLAWLIARNVSGSLRRLVDEVARLATAAVQGKLGERADAKLVSGEFQPILVGMNQTLDSVLDPLNVAATYVARMAKGDVPPKITDQYNGDFNTIKNNLNTLIETFNGFIADMTHMSQQHDLGDIDVMMAEDRYPGCYRTMAKGTNDMVKGHISVKKKAMACIAQFAAGNFDAELERFPGKKAFINENVELLRKNSKALIEDAVILSRAAVEGKLSTRADASRHQGDFRKIVQGVNDTLDAVIGPLNVAARYVELISKGNIPERITDQYNGDFNTIKNNLNQCIDAVHQLVADATMLAKAAVDGRLATRADASRHQGDFKTIVQGVNETLDAVINPVMEATRVLELLAAYDMTARMEGEYQGDHARIRDALNQTGRALHDALCQVAEAVEQVSEASRQIASSSQSVAQGSSEQASSLEETSSSLEEMASMTKQNADNTVQARTLAQTTKDAAERGGQAMTRMTDAMERIRAASEGTAQIIKDINEIAFQTNLLALNAAVEAARAGDAGRGFAVVAEEVRNLALRSKEAAKKTEDLIKQAVSHSENGRTITNEVATNLGDIVSAAGKVNDIVSEIAVASQEQSRGIDQVNTAVAEMDKVVQVAAANAEESSSAAEELSSQSEELAGLVGRFTLSRSQLRRPERSEAAARTRSQGLQAPVRRPTPAHRQAASGGNGAAKPGNGAVPKKRTPEELIPLASDPDFQDF